MPTQQQLEAATQAGYTPQQIKLALARSGANVPQRTGMSKWFFGDARSAPGAAFNAVGNVLNLPSYAIGGMMNQGQRAVGSKYGQQTDATGLGIIEGIKNKRAVFTEAPESFGVDPNSNAGMAIGLAGELLTPNIPVGKLAGLSKVNKLLGKAKPNAFSKVAGKFGGVGADAGETLLLKSYKLNASDINKIAESIGVTNEAEKATKVLAYLENLGLKGATKSSVRNLDSLVENAQKTYNSMVRTGNPIQRSQYAKALLQQAEEIERTAGDPATRSIAVALRNEAKSQMGFSKQGVGMTDEFLTNTKTKAFEAASPSSINNYYDTSVNEQIGRAGVRALDEYAPGSAEVGKQLRGLQTARNVVGKQARTGLGTQLINAFKPSAVGVGIGAGVGYTQGQNPLATGIAGGMVGVGLNNPKVLNLMGKTLSGSAKFNPGVPKGFNAGMKVMKKLPVTTGRIMVSREGQANQPRSEARPSQSQGGYTKPALTAQSQYKQPATYNAPKSPQAFGGSVKLKRGSFY